jgi:tetratricopeptide (TPR) repeat protein
MESGRPRAPKLRARPQGAASRAAACLMAAALIAVALVSCGVLGRSRAAAFSSSLGSIDERLSRRSGEYFGATDSRELAKLFAKAQRKASSAKDWLSLLKRANAARSAGDPGLYSSVADRAISSIPKSEPLAAAAAHAYLREGQPEKALALFKNSLSAELRPGLWAESFIVAASKPQASASVLKASAADYRRLAELASFPKAYLGASALALASGDRLGAAAWLEKAIAGGVRPSPELLWDCGLYETLATRYESESSSAELAMMGDAAWLVGKGDLARGRWERSLAKGPRRSWKPYSNLASISAGKEEEESWLARLKSAFLSGPASEARDGALAAYAAALAREGRDAEALAVLKGGEPTSSTAGLLAITELAIRGRSMPEGRLASELERLAADRPGDANVAGEALRKLYARGLFGEVAILESTASGRGLGLEYGWYYQAAMLAGRGDLAGAEKAILESAAGAASAEGCYALGGIYAAMGGPARAAAAYSRAADAARDGGARCAAYKAMGRQLGAAGDSAAAVKAYRAALAADPRDPEAAMLARGAVAKQS